MDKWLLHLIYAFHGYGVLVYVFVTTIISALLSFCVGLERQLRGEQAGVRFVSEPVKKHGPGKTAGRSGREKAGDR